MDGLNPRFSFSFALAFLACAKFAHAQVAPPPAPPIISGGAPFSIESPSTPSGQLYSIGDPTNDEQYYLELINRARANPTAEGIRLATTTDPDVRGAYASFGVNLVLMQAQFALIPPQPPLSMNATLLNAARAHSQNMLQNNYQGHSGPDGSLTTRLAGYTAGANGWSIGENVYAYSKSVWYGHAGFEVDWGGTPLNGGMQSPPGHRQNIHSPDFREVGIGNVIGSNGGSGGVGPQLVTQDFGTKGGLLPFVTGVVYRDLNGNGFYDPGEGIGGVTVTIANVNSYAVTAASGGFSVPVPGSGTYNVLLRRFCSDEPARRKRRQRAKCEAGLHRHRLGNANADADAERADEIGEHLYARRCRHRRQRFDRRLHRYRHPKQTGDRSRHRAVASVAGQNPRSDS